MTIAAGFVHQNGVLLCSDTQQEAGSLKLHAPKLGHFECADGKIAMAYAGNSAFAISAVQHCRKRLAAVKSPGKTIEILENVLDHEYRRVVLGHPDHNSDWNLAYWLLIAFWKREKNAVSLFATEQMTLRSVFDYECIGIGREMGHYLVRPSFDTVMSERQVLVLASYMLGIVKEYVPGCGGISQFMAIRKDGTIELVDSPDADFIENEADPFDQTAHRLLFALADESVTDDAFEKEVQAFVQRVKAVRNVLRAVRQQRALIRDQQNKA